MLDDSAREYHPRLKLLTEQLTTLETRYAPLKSLLTDYLNQVTSGPATVRTT